MEQAQLDFERTRKNYEALIVSEAEYQRARSAFEGAQAAYQATLNRVEQTRAGLNANRDTLSKTTIVAPIDGIVTTLRVIDLNPDVIVFTKYGIIRSRQEFILARKRKPVTLRDMELVRAECLSCGAVGAEGDEVAIVKAGSRKLSAVPVTGYTANAVSLLNIELSSGRFFTPAEEEHSTAVAIIGSGVKDQLFPNLDPVGRTVYVRGYPLRVVGLQAKLGKVLGQNRNLRTFGANRIEVQKYDDRFGPGGPLTDEDRKRKNLTVDDAEVKVSSGNVQANTPYVVAGDEYYPIGTASSLGKGRYFTPTEVAHSAQLVVLGAEVEEVLFPGQDPIGRDVTVNGTRYRVVGVLTRKGAQFGYSPDNKVVLPHGAFAKQFGFRIRRDGIRLQVVPRRTEDLEAVIEKTVAVLRVRRRVPFDKPNDFAVVTPDQLISQFRAITGGVTGAMVFVALVSLVIGGVGVMNIMLVSVTQRTREIGVRRAVGALRRSGSRPARAPGSAAVRQSAD